MRISDWSSDVCSSDLADARAPAAAVEIRKRDDRQRDQRDHHDDALDEIGQADGQKAAQHDIGDRKSVESGKRVSVRVDFGGSCIIKKTSTASTQYSSLI